MATQSKNCACPSPEIVAIPGVQGDTGATGTAGINGVNSYTVITSNVTIPTTNSTTSIPVANVSWMVVGQNIFISDQTSKANFLITAIQVTPPVVTGKALGYNGDSSASVVLSSGATVSPGGVQGSDGFSAVATNSFSTGGSQTINATPTQALSSSVSLTGSAGKTYVLTAFCRIDYVGATFSANQILTLKIRRTNNTAGDIASSTLLLQIVTTATFSMGQIAIISFPYTTVGASDVIQPFISVNSTPSTGSIQVIEASITAIRLT